MTINILILIIAGIYVLVFVFLLIDFDQECMGNARCISGKVTQITDGDTIQVDGQSIRFALTSTPELFEENGILAKEFVENVCPVGSSVFVDEDDGQTKGSFGRIIGVVYCNGETLNQLVLESGNGKISTEFCSESEFSNTEWAKSNGC